MPDLTTILATALHGANIGCHYERKFEIRKSCEPGSARHSVVAQAIVAAIPDVKRNALDLGLTWLRVTRALPEGWAIHLDSNLDLASFSASADPLDGGRPRPFETGYGPTPTAALTALAEALEARRG